MRQSSLIAEQLSKLSADSQRQQSLSEILCVNHNCRIPDDCMVFLPPVLSAPPSTHRLRHSVHLKRQVFSLTGRHGERIYRPPHPNTPYPRRTASSSIAVMVW